MLRPGTLLHLDLDGSARDTFSRLQSALPIRGPEGPRCHRGSSVLVVPSPYWPVPVSLITAGPSGALWVTVAAPVIDPFTLGVNVTLNVQVAPAATVDPQGEPPEGDAL